MGITRISLSTGREKTSAPPPPTAGARSLIRVRILLCEPISIPVPRTVTHDPGHPPAADTISETDESIVTDESSRDGRVHHLEHAAIRPRELQEKWCFW